MPAKDVCCLVLLLQRAGCRQVDHRDKHPGGNHGAGAARRSGDGGSIGCRNAARTGTDSIVSFPGAILANGGNGSSPSDSETEVQRHSFSVDVEQRRFISLAGDNDSAWGGFNIASSVGLADGMLEGVDVGELDGFDEGLKEGDVEGNVLGLVLGVAEGAAEGEAEGLLEGLDDGLKEGDDAWPMGGGFYIECNTR